MHRLRYNFLPFLFTCFHQFSMAWNEPVFSTLETIQFGINKTSYLEWDKFGRVWIITDKGLMVYNGYKSEIKNGQPGNAKRPLSNRIRLMLKVSDDEFWLSYSDNTALTYFNPNNENYSHIECDTVNKPGFPDIILTNVIKEDDSTRWLLTWGQGIIKYNIKSKTWRQFRNEDDIYETGEFPVNLIKDMVRIDDEKYLVGFFKESHFATPCYFYPETGKIEKLDLTESLSRHDEAMSKMITQALTMIHFIHVDQLKNIWFGTYIGLVHYDPKNKIIQRLSASTNDLYRQNLENTRSITEDHQGLLWITTANQGVIIADPVTLELHYIKHSMYNPNSVADDRIATVAGDPFGNIWLSTSSGNISIYHVLQQEFKIHSWTKMNLDFTNRSVQEIPVNQILVQKNGKIFISNATGIVEYDTKKGQLTDFFIGSKIIGDVSNNRGIEYFRKTGDFLYFKIPMKNNPNMVIRYEISTGSIEKYQNIQGFFMPFFRHSDNNEPLIISGGVDKSTVYHMNDKTKTIDPIFQPDKPTQINEYFTIKIDSVNWLIPIQKSNVAILTVSEPKLVPYQRDSSDLIYPDSTILCGMKDQDNNIWLGSETGIYKQKSGETKFVKYNKNTGLDSIERVNWIYQDTIGNFWIGVTREIIHWSTNTNQHYRFNHSHGINVGNFLPAAPQSDSLGNLYVATYHGILEFNPYTLELPDHNLIIYLEEVKLLNESIEKTKFESPGFLLNPDENFLTFEFFTNETFTLTPTRFYYRLTGRDTSWTDNGYSNKIRLEDINHGAYTLEVKALNTYGTESEIASYSFTIDKPFYLKWWFILSITILLVVLIWWYIRIREKVLREKSLQLERIVTQRTAEVVNEKKEAEKQKQLAEHQKELVEEKQKEITDSISYAKRIQEAILPSDNYFRKNLPQSFILYIPKDLVAGDFYFMEDTGEHLILAVADCTGHGVPGAMVSVVCHNALTRAVKEFGLTDPAKILDKTRELILETFSKSENQVNDGMDIAICSIEKRINKIHFSGANNGLIIFRNNELNELKPDKQPVGKFINAKPFTSQHYSYQTGDYFYLYSDGYADQFGGDAGKPGGKKLKYSRLKTILQEIHTKKPEEQKKFLDDFMIQWRGEIEQVDDVCIIGFSIA